MGLEGILNNTIKSLKKAACIGLASLALSGVIGKTVQGGNSNESSYNAAKIIYVDDDAAGATWEPMVSSTTEFLRDIWGTASDNIFAVGYSGTILHYDGDGNNDGVPDQIWEQMPSPTTAYLCGIWGSGADDVWAVGDNGTILRRQNGKDWEKIPELNIPVPSDTGFNSVWGTAPDNIYVVGQYQSPGQDDEGAILHWNGRSWTNDHGRISGPLGLAMQFNAVWGRGSNEIFVVGHNGYSWDVEGVCYKYDGTQWSWEWSGTGWPKTGTFTGIWGTADELFISAQAFGIPSDWYAETVHYDGSEWRTEVLRGAGLQCVWGSARDDVYMVSYYGKILHYDGSTWSDMDAGTTESLHGIWGDSLGNVFAVGANGVILAYKPLIYEPGVIYVDGINGDDNNNGLSEKTAFATIQKGINLVEDGFTVFVYPGVYRERINFEGKAITLQGTATSTGIPILESLDDFAVLFYNGENYNSVLKNFVIRNSFMAAFIAGSSPTISNLNIVDNKYGIEAYVGSEPNITNCIFWNNTGSDLFGCEANYSCVKLPGKGNIDANPLFVDSNEEGYYLLSERGRYWPQHDTWVLDKVTSPCIDAGDPKADYSKEPLPNGRRIDIGAYGGTPYASMSEIKWLNGDINHDDKVNMIDLAMLAENWLADYEE